MKISVVIPAYRAARTIGRAVGSVLAQTHPPFEILVVDDGSPDDIATALAPFGNQVKLIRKANGGAGSARNLGIDRSSGDVVAFLDADDFWEPQKLQRQCAILSGNPDIGLTSSTWLEQSPGLAREAIALDTKELDRPLSPVRDRISKLASMIWTSTVAVRRQIVESMRFDPDLRTAQDRELWIRIVAAHTVFICSDPLATAVLESGSLSRTNLDRDCTNMLRVIRRHHALLGPRQSRTWETQVYRRWAGQYLATGESRAAIRPALKRLARQPLSLEGWWIAAKSLVRGVVRPTPQT